MNLPVKTLQDIRDYEPCYDPTKYLSEDWQGTALDILKVDAVSIQDRFWVVLRKGWIDDKTLRLFAVWCAREALLLIDNPDPRSVAACDVTERYAYGEATKDELAVARDAARDAARVAARDAARAAARDAVWAAAWTAASAARSVAKDAARVAARDAVRAAARDAALEKQLKKLVKMLEVE